MTIKQHGGIFGRNPTFNDLTVNGNATISDDLTVDTSTLVVDSTNNRVGIGEATPDRTLHVNSGNTNEVAKFESTDTEVTLEFTDTTGTAKFKTRADFRFETGTGTPTEAARLNTSGDLLVAKTSQNVDTDGIELRASGVFVATADGATPIFANRRSSDGAIATFMRSGSTVGSIACRSSGGNLQLDTVQSGIDFSGSGWLPMRNGSIVDNDLDIGSASFRFDDIYATNATIQTSDRNLKQDIAEISDAERRVAAAAKGLLRKFRWQSAVAEKGDDARIHFGIIAQDLQDAFTAEGLDAGDYAMFTSATWWEADEVIPAIEAVDEVVDEEGNVITEAVEAQPERTETRTYETAEEAPEDAVEKTRLGVRYSELLAFIIAAI
jgi:hypothetical protein